MNKNEKILLSGDWLGSTWLDDRIFSSGRPWAFRGEFMLETRLSEPAILRVSSCEYYAFFVNGRLVSRGPSRSTERTKAYDEINISSFLREGRNALAVLVTVPSGEVSHRGRFGFWCEATSGTKLLFCTGGDWLVRCAVWYSEIAPAAAASASRQEHRLDNLQEEPDWLVRPMAELADVWQKPFIIGPVDWTPPWRTLRPRQTSPLSYSNLPLTVVGHWTSSPELTPLSELALSFSKLEFRPETGRNFTGNVVAGEVWTFDLGCTRLCAPRLRVKELQGNLRLEFYIDIKFKGCPSATLPYETAGAGLCDSWQPATPGSEYEPIVLRGGRFWTMRAAGTGRCRIELELQAADYPYEKINRLCSRDRRLEEYWKMAARTVRSSTMDVFVDTCWREQALWTRDAAVMGPNAFWLFGDLAVWKESSRLIAEGIDEDGVPHAVVPSQISHLVLFDQTFSWIVSLEKYFMFSGDEEFIRRLWPAILRLAHLASGYVTADDIFVPPSWSWHFIDWAKLSKRPYSLTIQVMAFRAFAAICRLGRLTDSGLPDWLEECRVRLLAGIERFHDRESGEFRGHLPTPDSVVSGGDMDYIRNDYPEVKPVHGVALILQEQLGDREQNRRLAALLAGYLQPIEKTDELFGTSWLAVMLEVLFRNDQAETAWKLMHQRCGMALTVGAPTFGEDFPFQQFNSAHGWSAGVAESLVEAAWGLQILEPGCRKIRLQPASGLPDGEISLWTPAGILQAETIAGRCRIIQGGMKVELG